MVYHRPLFSPNAQHSVNHWIGTVIAGTFFVCMIVVSGASNAQEKEPRYDFGSVVDVEIDIREKSDKAPDDSSSEFVAKESIKRQKEWSSTSAHWEAPNLTYQPLYFEDVALERYGQKHGKIGQIVFSSWDFTINSYLLPYHMLLNRPRKKISPVGFGRPGNCMPLTHENHWLR